MKNKKVRILIRVIIVVFIVGIIGFVSWTKLIYKPMDEAINYLKDDKKVIVNNDEFLIFNPKESNNKIGLIIYPGGKVDHRAYAPIARKIALKGYKVIIVPMPLNLAVFGKDKAKDVMDKFKDIESWAIAGHSLGGTMAASFTDNNPEKINGLILWASYPAKSNNLSNNNIEVASIYGTEDGLSTVEKINERKNLLPKSTHWVMIKGGNHSQFGWYGFQKGDNKANIDRKKQQSIIIDSTIEILNEINKD